MNNIYDLLNFSVALENVSYPSGTGNHFEIKSNSNSIVESVSKDFEGFEELPLVLIALDGLISIDNNQQIGKIKFTFSNESNY